MHLRAQIPRNDIQRLVAAWGKPGTATEGQSHYPTDFTRGIIPIPCHSHNDYERKVPLYDALLAGCISVEADVWLRDGDLLVGHSENSLTPARTLRSLYLEPLFSILSHQHASEISKPRPSENKSYPFVDKVRGIFESDTNVSLTLLVDIKSDGQETLPAIMQQLEPFRSRGWLTHTSNSTLIPGPLTIVGSGNMPFAATEFNEGHTRDIFFDAPLAAFWGENPDTSGPVRHTAFDTSNSVYASADFLEVVGRLWHGMLSPAQVETIRAHVQAAVAQGLKARFWNTPVWPVRVKDHVWDVLVKEGVGLLSVDDLEGVRTRKW
ncbi:MAG: hypothetical protein Q9222_000954 [Ikaeria aurantiellina]